MACRRTTRRRSPQSKEQSSAAKQRYAKLSARTLPLAICEKTSLEDTLRARNRGNVEGTVLIQFCAEAQPANVLCSAHRSHRPRRVERVLCRDRIFVSRRKNFARAPTGGAGKRQRQNH